MRKFFDNEEDADELTESLKTISTATAHVKYEDLLDDIIDVELAKAEDFDDEMKEAYGILRA